MAEGDNAGVGGGGTAGVDGTEGAGVGGVATGCAKSEAESDEESGVGIKEVRKSMRLFAQSTNRLYWRNQCNPITAEISGSRGVTRKLTGRILPGAKETGMVTS